MRQAGLVNQSTATFGTVSYVNTTGSPAAPLCITPFRSFAEYCIFSPVVAKACVVPEPGVAAATVATGLMALMR